MAQNSKLGLIILIIFCVIFAGTSIAFYVMHAKEYQKRVQVEQQLSLVKVKKTQIEKELEQMKEDKEKIEENLSKYKEEARQLIDGIENEREQRRQIQTKLQSKEDQLVKLKADLDDTKDKIKRFQEEYEDLEKENENLSQELNQLRMAKRALESRIGTAASDSEGVELGTVVVKSGQEQTQQVQQESQGRILVVNREFDFVMINLGSNNGIENGTIFGVYRQERLIAKVEAERVYEDMCSAVILSEDKKGNIQEDDKVKML